MALACFSPFQRLPQELQDEIWEYAAEDRDEMRGVKFAALEFRAFSEQFIGYRAYGFNGNVRDTMELLVNAPFPRDHLQATTQPQINTSSIPRAGMSTTVAMLWVCRGSRRVALRQRGSSGPRRILQIYEGHPFIKRTMAVLAALRDPNSTPGQLVEPRILPNIPSHFVRPDKTLVIFTAGLNKGKDMRHSPSVYREWSLPVQQVDYLGIIWGHDYKNVSFTDPIAIATTIRNAVSCGRFQSKVIYIIVDPNTLWGDDTSTTEADVKPVTWRLDKLRQHLGEYKKESETVPERFCFGKRIYYVVHPDDLSKAVSAHGRLNTVLEAVIMARGRKHECGDSDLQNRDCMLRSGGGLGVSPRECTRRKAWRIMTWWDYNFASTRVKNEVVGVDDD